MITRSAWPRYPLEGVRYPDATLVSRYLDAHAWKASTLGDECRAAAIEYPQQPFLIGDDRSLTYAEFDARSECLAAALLQRGLVPGDRALFQLGTEIDTAVALMGCFKAGILPVCTLPQHRAVEIAAIGSVTRPSAYFVQADFGSFDLVGFAQDMAAKLQTVKQLIVTRGDAPNSLDALWQSVDPTHARPMTMSITPSPADACILQLSGGSTGIPKIIPRFHGDYLGTAVCWNQRLGLAQSDVGLWALPLIHNAAMVLMLWPVLVLRASLVLKRRFDVADFLSAIERHRVTYAGSVGPIAPRLLEYGDVHRHDISSLRLFITLSRGDSIERHLGTRTVTLYGITEGLLTTSGAQDSPAARLETIGRPTMPLEDIRVCDPVTGQPVPEGECGELCFRGPTTLLGYFASPAESAGSFTSDGFFRSGDLVRARLIDNKWHYHFEGRLTDNINRGGEKFGAEEVERYIAKHPAVLDAKVVPMPDAHYGERACAFLVIRPETRCPSIAELGAFLLAEGLAKYKLPERVESIEALPVTNAGKIDKAALRKLARDTQGTPP